MGSQASRPDHTVSEEHVTAKDDNDDAQTAAPEQDDDEPDEWDKRIFSTGCADENAKMTDCYFEKKDWRACAAEMEQFKQCWKVHGNDARTETKDS